jgi:hypothetical protein
MSATLVPIYRAGRQLRKVRAMVWFLALVAAGAIYYGADIGRTYGIREADGGTLKPLGVRLAFGGFVGLLGIAAAAGMLVYARHYIARVAFDEASGRFEIRTVGLLGSRRHMCELRPGGRAEYRDPSVPFSAVSVDAPWWSVEVVGGQWPLILDAQGQVLDAARFKQFLSGRVKL